MKQEIEIFERYVNEKGLKRSWKRHEIVKTFLNTKRHVSAEDLCQLIKEEYPEIGYTTVYRTLKLIVDCGLGEVVDFDDGLKRFERKIGREYHAHFICTKCGNNFEVFDTNIEYLSSRLAKEKGFLPKKQRFEIFGLCSKCS